MLDSGYIQLGSRSKPPLPGGRYTVTAAQSTGDDDGKCAIPGCEIADAAFTFDCGAEPFTLNQSEVYSVYPPSGARGKFDLVLPHLVLTRRTMPWERSPICADGKKRDAPWLLLLLFDEREAPDITQRKSTCAEAFGAAEPGLYCPVRYEAERANDNCMVIDVPAPLFCDVCPTATDAALLTHVKGVSRLKKPTEPIPLGDWLSVLIASRYPASNTGETGVANTVYLASCENFADFMENDIERSRVRGNYAHVRMPVLYSWNFYSSKDDYDFKTVFENLDAGSLRLPPPDGLSGQAAALLDMGYAPVDHVTRDGGETVSWYHGPFVPYPGEAQHASSALFSDRRLVYDPEMGMFDISYAAAFNLGRALALKSEAYASALDRWRHESKRAAGKAAEFSALNRALGGKNINAKTAIDAAQTEAVLLARAEALAEKLLKREN